MPYTRSGSNYRARVLSWHGAGRAVPPGAAVRALAACRMRPINTDFLAWSSDLTDRRPDRTRVSWRSSSKSLDRHRDGFSATDAQRGDSALELSLFEGVQQCHQDATAGGADGVS